MKRYIFLFILMAVPLQYAFAQINISSNGTGSTLDKLEVKPFSKYDSLKAGEVAQFAVVVHIEDGWHVNAHNPTLDYLIGVDVSVDAGDHAMVSDIQYPKSKEMQFSFAEDKLNVYEGQSEILLKMKTSDKLEPGTYAIPGTLTVQACSDKVCLPPADVELNFPLTIGKQTSSSAKHKTLFRELNNRETASGTLDEGNQIASRFNQKGNFWAFFSIFLIGLALNLTPCVYPMMSVTVSLFGGTDAKDTATTASTFSKALVYVMGIVFMYSVLGVVAAYTGNLFGSWLQSSWLLAAIGLLILLLSLSMFGLYELQPPPWMMQKLGNTQQAGGYIGHFLSGLLVGVFAAPCIGPPIIALLAFVGAQASPAFGFFAFFVMALGLGVPYLILGTFSGLLAKMPKSGVWMIWVKKVFGVVLIGVALFYLALAFAPDYAMYAVLATVVIGGIYLGFVEQSGNEKYPFRWLKYVAGAGAVLAGFFLFQNLQKEGIKWQTYDSMLVEQADRPVMLDFYADWCIPCIELDRKTFTNERVIEETQSFIRMKVDLTHFDSKYAEKLRREYDIAGVPTILFLNSQGKEVKKARVVGFLNANNFLKHIHKVE